MNAPDAVPPVPFLSIVVPVGVVGEQALRETLLCLAGQDDLDFEALLVVADNSSPVDTGAVVADQPRRLASRLRVVPITAATPGAVRNAGVAAARGRHVAVLPEGDLVLGSWVAAFHAAEPAAAGRILRARGVSQDHALVEVAGRPAVRAVDSPRSESPAVFSRWQHALEPLTPPAAWAWPRELVDQHSIGYDDTVLDDPDWELLVRITELVDVLDLGTVTSVRRRWTSTPVVAPPGGGATAQERIDARPLLLPPGEAARMRSASAVSAETQELRDELARTREELRLTHDHATNLEGIVRHLEDTAARAERRRMKEEARARRKADAEPVAPDPADTSGERPEGTRGWRRKGRGRGSSD